MPSTRRSLLIASAAVAAGCTDLTSTGTPGDDSDSPDSSTETPTRSGSADGPEYARWRREFPHDALGVLSLGGGPETPAIFVGSGVTESDADSENHALHALSLQDGSRQWRVDTPDPVQSRPRFAGTAENPRVVFATGRESLHGEAFEVDAIDHGSGDRVWRFDGDDRRFLHPIVATSESVYVGRHDDQPYASGELLYALDAIDGDERWRTESGDVSRGGNARRRDTLLVSTVGQIQAFDTADGDDRWQAAADSVGFDNRAERVFVEADDSVRGLALEDGRELWSRDFDVGLTRITTPRAAMDETVFAGDENGRLHALSPSDGTTRWTRSVAEGAFVPRVERTSERLFVAGAGIRALDPVSGDQHWSFTPDGQRDMTVHASRTVFASTDRTLWALDPESGDERWAFEPGGEFVGVANAGNLAFVGVGDTAYALDGEQSP